MSDWITACQTHVGQQRTRNEDAVGVIDHGELGWSLLVCDGMGGHEDGDVASATAIARLNEILTARAAETSTSRLLHEALVSADQAIAAAGRPMGSTGVVARLRGAQVWYGWVGDSRLYILRNGHIIEKSEDHTRVAAMVASGELTVEAARAHPDAHMLTQALGSGAARPTVYAEPFESAHGDVVLLCSDGLHDLVDDHELGGEIAGLTPAEACNHLIALANSRGGHDNISVAIASFGEPRIPGATRRTLEDGARGELGGVAPASTPTTLQDSGEYRRATGARRSDDRPSDRSAPAGPVRAEPDPIDAEAPNIAAVAVLAGLLGFALGSILTAWVIHLVTPEPTAVVCPP
jgi:protein phosphatase